MSGIIRLLPNTRTALNVDDADLIEVQIMDGSADDKESAHMSIGELKKAVNDGVVPLKYKALLSQNAPIAATSTPTVVAGQIWELTIFNTGDEAKIDDLELISGTIYVVGSKYRSSIDAVISFTNGSQIKYDGSPYIVSTDINGDLNPFVNTIGVISFNYSGSTGNFYILFPDLIDINKTSVNIIGNGDAVSGNGSYYIDAIDKTSTSYYYYFSTRNNIADLLDDNLMQFDKIEIEIYP